MKYDIKKINKRLFVVDDSGQKVYSMPDYIRHNLVSKQELREKLVDRLNAGDSYISAVMDFEYELHNQTLRKKYPEYF